MKAVCRWSDLRTYLTSLCGCAVFCFTLLCLSATAFGQSPVATRPGGEIRGFVKSGNQPIPGVTITAANTLTGQKVSTSTDVNGAYALHVPANGRYVISSQMAAFAPNTAEVLINAANHDGQANLELILLSRAQQAAQVAQRREAGSDNGFQNLSLVQGAMGDSTMGGAADQSAAPDMLPGMSENAATESVAVSGDTSNPMATMSSEEIRARIQEFRQQRSGFGGFGGGFGGGGGGFAMIFRGSRGGFNVNQPHGSVYYDVGDDALDAAPYALPHQSTSKPSFLQNNFGAAIGGPLNIPKIFNAGSKTFFFFNYNGSRGSSPFDAYSNVPTLAERSGDFSGVVYPSGPNAGLPVQIFDPITGQQITTVPVNPIAQGLLQYIPLPNQPAGSAQNFHYVTSTNTSTDSLNIRLNRSLGSAASGPFRFRGPRNNLSFGFHYSHSTSNLTNSFPTLGGQSTVHSYDVPLGYVRSFGRLTNIVGFDFDRNTAQTQNLYAYNQNIAGQLGITGVSQNPFDWGVPTLSFTDLTGLQDTTPSLQRNQTISLSDTMIWRHGKHTFRWGGAFRRIQFNTQSDANPRGSFVFTGINTAEIGSNAQAVPGTGFDFADFLLGLPQQTSVQYGIDQFSTNSYHFRANSWDVYGQDNWRARGNLTFNLGLRYEYVSPYTEINNRIASLNVSPSFDPNVFPVAVEAGNSSLPATLVRPDRNNFAPRVGFAWKALSKTVVRGGYGINYNIGEYQSIAQDMAYQPPFATAETNVQAFPGQLTLMNGFPSHPSNAVTNTYAVDPNYRLGYVQIWNLDVQQEIRPTLLLNVDYTGTKGTALDILEEPNRYIAPNNTSCTSNPYLVWCGFSPFYWETSRGNSIMHAGSVSLRKRLQGGISIGGTYTFSKSLDDASSIGNGIVISQASGGFGGGGFGGGFGGRGEGEGESSGVVAGSTSVAQNPFDLAAERGLSSFNQTHDFTADFLFELPFGHDKRWLPTGGPLTAIFGDWQWSGDWTIASGLPFTPRILGNFSSVNGAANGTLRPNVVPGASVSQPDPGIAQWFNTAAFVEPPTGTYGDARRNSIIGPGTVLVDMAMTKVFPMSEGKVMEFRISADNVFNHPNYASIDTTLGSTTFGQVVSVGSMRTAQLTARFRF